MRTVMILVFASAGSRPPPSVSLSEDIKPSASKATGAAPSQAPDRLIPPVAPANGADPSQAAGQPIAPTPVNGAGPSQGASQANAPQTPAKPLTAHPESARPQHAEPTLPRLSLPAAEPVLEVFHWRALAEQYCTRSVECLPSESAPVAECMTAFVGSVCAQLDCTQPSRFYLPTWQRCLDGIRTMPCDTFDGGDAPVCDVVRPFDPAPSGSPSTSSR